MSLRVGAVALLTIAVACSPTKSVERPHFEQTAGSILSIGTTTSFRVDGDALRVLDASFRTVGEPGSVRLDDESVYIQRKGVVERLKLVGDAVEQTWTWTAKPVGDVSAQVRVEVRDARIRGVDSEGVHLEAKGGALVYGHGTLVDAAGARESVNATIEAGEIVFHISREILDRATYPLVLDPVVGVDHDVTTSTGVRYLYPPRGAKAFGTGTGYLVVAPSTSHFVSARVGTDGKVTDKPARVSATLSAEVVEWDADWNGTNILAAARQGSAIRGVLLAKDGTAVGAPFDIVTAIPAAYVSDLEVVASGTQWLLIFRTYDSATAITTIHGVRIDSAGKVLDATPRALAPIPSLSALSAAGDGSGWLIALAHTDTSPPQIAAIKVASDGSSHGTGDLVPFGVDGMQLIFDPAGNEYRLRDYHSIYRISTDGVVVGIPATTFETLYLWRTETEAHAALYTGSVYDTAFGASSNVVVPAATVVPYVGSAGTISITSTGAQGLFVAGGFGSRFSLSPTESSLDTEMFEILSRPADEGPFAIASDGTRVLAIWEELEGTSTSNVLSGLYSKSGLSLDTPSGTSFQPVATFDGTSYIAATYTGVARLSPDRAVVDSITLPRPVAMASTGGITLTGSGSSLTRIDDKGNTLDTTPIGIGGTHAIAGGGGKFLVVWTSGSNVVASRVTTGGVVEDTVPVVIGNGTDAVDVTYANGAFFIAYEDTTGSVRVRRMGIDGILDASEAPLGVGHLPSIASSGERLLVTSVAQVGDLPQSLYGRVLDARTAKPVGLAFTVASDVKPATAHFLDMGNGEFVGGYIARDATGSARLRILPVSIGKLLGNACSASSECEVGTCVDGVCCDSACSGQCEACDTPANPGHCAAIEGTPHGARAACTATPSTCASRCDGVSRMACTFPDAMTPCGADACMAGVETHASTCDGAGACKDGTKSCGAYACAGMVCRTDCAKDADCAAGFACSAGACVATKGSAIACTHDSECSTGFCTDGVCCNQRCDRQCEACDVAGSVGTCRPAAGAPHGDRPGCLQSPSNVCASTTCDGVVSTHCAAFAGADVVCHVATCVDGTATERSTCDGAGSCSSGTTTSCAGKPCDGDHCAITDAATEVGGGGCSTTAGNKAPRHAWLLVVACLAYGFRRRRSWFLSHQYERLASLEEFAHPTAQRGPLLH